MLLSPHSGTFKKPFTVDVVIDGHGDKFNAAEATVSLSSGLAAKDMTFGDCKFSFLKTPSTQSPSFAGMILSTYSTKCTVYSLTLVPTAKTTAHVTISKASVKRFGDAADVLSSASGGTYTLTAALAPPTAPSAQSATTSQTGLYTVNFKTSSAQNTPVSNALVTLNAVSDKKTQNAPTDATGTAHFSGLKAGIYDAVVSVNNQKAGEIIINVSGNDHFLNFGINLKAQKGNPLLKRSGSVLGATASSPYITVAVLTIGIIAGILIAIFVYKFRARAQASHK